MLKIISFIFLVLIGCAANVKQSQKIDKVAQDREEKIIFREKIKNWGDDYKRVIAGYEKAKTERDIMIVLEAMKNILEKAPTESAKEHVEKNLCLIAAGIGDPNFFDFKCAEKEPFSYLVK